MYAGQMRTRILLQRPVRSQLPDGQPVDGWEDVGPDWADARTLQGLEAIKADATAHTARMSCRLRYRADITSDMRVLVAGEAWGIVSQQPEVGRRRFVDLVLERTT